MSRPLSTNTATRVRNHKRVVLSAGPRVRRNNAMLQGSGASDTQDRGSMQSLATTTMNPYYNTNFFARWRELVSWYYTDWAARKIIDIPVEDVMRKPFSIKGITETHAKILMKEYERLNGDKQFRRAMKQERLLGGDLIYMVTADNSAYVDNPINFQALKKGSLKAINVIDIQKICQTQNINDPFHPDYDKPQQYSINGIPVDHSRLIAFEGDVLFNRQTTNIYQQWRVNPSGFGESILTPLYDLMIRVTGTQEGAYHLVNLASVLLMKVSDLKALQFGNNPALSKIKEMMETISIYRAAILDGTNAEITQHSASFGSVPELVVSFLQILSAACDIPATRFLGQAPGGLNATGESDLENYYNVIDSYQRLRLKPKLMQLFSVIGASEFGFSQWLKMKETFDLEFPPLWNMDEKEQAEVNKSLVETYVSLYQEGMLTKEQIIDELKASNVFITEVELDAELAKEQDEPEELIDPEAELDKLKQAGDMEGKKKKDEKQKA